MAKDESLGSIVGGLLGAFANEVDIFSGSEKSGPNNTAGNASHSQSGGLFGGDSSGSSEQNGNTTIHHGSKGTETGRTERRDSNLTHFDAGSPFFGGLDRQQTGHTIVNGNRSSHYDNSGNLIGWSITNDDGRIDSYDRNGNHTYTSHTSVDHTPTGDSAPWSTNGNVEGGSSKFRTRAVKRHTVTRSVNIEWVSIGRLAITVLVLSLLVGICTMVVRSFNRPIVASKSKTSRSRVLDKSGRAVSGTQAKEYVNKPPRRTDQPKQGTTRPIIIHRSDGTTLQLSLQETAGGVLEGRYQVDSSGYITEKLDPASK